MRYEQEDSNHAGERRHRSYWGIGFLQSNHFTQSSLFHNLYLLTPTVEMGWA
jgi:hypothetical protein